MRNWKMLVFFFLTALHTQFQLRERVLLSPESCCICLLNPCSWSNWILTNTDLTAWWGLKMHIWVYWSADFLLNWLSALEFFHSVCMCLMWDCMCVNTHWPADGVDLVCVFVLPSAVCQTVAQSHQTLSKAFIDGVTPPGCSNRARA